MKTTNWKTLACGLAAALALAVAAQPGAADPEGEQKVRIKKIVKCQDGDCTETVERLGEGEDLEVLVGEAGGKKVRIHKIVCDGEDCPDAEGLHTMVFRGDGGDVRVMKMGGGDHHWVHHGAMAGGGYLGVGLTDLTPELRAHFGVPGDAGVLVAKVVDGSPAQRAGIEVGDVVTSAGGEPVASGHELAHRVRSSEEGAALTLELTRDGAPLTVTATIEAGPPSHGELAGGERRMRKVIVACDDDEEDCDAAPSLAGMEGYDCGAEECEVEVRCEDGDCSCVVNGEATDCAGIPGVPSR